MAKPNKKGPSKTVDIYCSKCQHALFKYQKGGKGALLKCYKQRISKDFTDITCTCPNCDSIFAREMLIKGTPAYKIIGGKVWFK
jgi:hypothetical protein